MSTVKRNKVAHRLLEAAFPWRDCFTRKCTSPSNYVHLLVILKTLPAFSATILFDDYFKYQIAQGRGPARPGCSGLSEGGTAVPCGIAMELVY